MKNTNKRALLITTLACLLPAVLGMALYGLLPEALPTHWGIDGKVDQYSSKSVVIFGMPFLFAALNLVLNFLLDADPKRRNMSVVLRRVCWWIMPAMGFLCIGLTYLTALGMKNFPVETIIPILVGGIFLLIGNYLPKCKQNYTMGIRLPWTLNDEENWNKTHHLAGWVWIVGGILVVADGFLHTNWLMITALAAMVLIPSFYSYWFYCRKKQK